MRCCEIDVGPKKLSTRHHREQLAEHTLRANFIVEHDFNHSVNASNINRRTIPLLVIVCTASINTRNKEDQRVYSPIFDTSNSPMNAFRTPLISENIEIWGATSLLWDTHPCFVRVVIGPTNERGSESLMTPCRAMMLIFKGTGEADCESC